MDLDLSTEGQLDPPASLRTPVRLVYHCVVGVGSGPFPPLKPAGALVLDRPKNYFFGKLETGENYIS